MRLLIAEDQRDLTEALTFLFEKNQFTVDAVYDGRSAYDYAVAGSYDAIILDVMMPGLSGSDACMQVREFSNVPIIMLTARSQEMDKVTGLMTGADDYVTKPFSPAELTARVDALVRRLGNDAGDKSSYEISSGPFLLNTRNRTLEKDCKRLKLTQIEYLLMKLFMENPGKAMSREDILKAVWGDDFSGELKTVDVNIRRLRLKIEADPTEPEFLTTVWGFGYKWGY